MIEPEQATRRLVREHPDWLPVLEAAVAVAAEVEATGGEFAGAWVLAKLEAQGLPVWIPNLRRLVSYGLIAKSGPSTRGGRRAYYRMPDRAAIERALEELRAQGQARPRLRFIASGRSGDKASDTARRSDELDYEPRSWR